MNAERQEKNRPEKKQPHFKVAPLPPFLRAQPGAENRRPRSQVAELLLASGAKPNEHDAWGQARPITATRSATSDFNRLSTALPE
jgi:hypothetical protein